MRSLVDVMSHNNELFSRLAIHPSTNFPGRTQENILLQLLRKKPEPDVATSMDEGRKMYRETAESVGLTEDPVKREREKGGDDEDDPESMFGMQWGAARVFIGNRSEKYIKSGESEDPFTKEEREIGVENVRTGLRRVLEEYEDDEDEEDEDGGKKEQVPGMEEDDEDDVVMYDQAPPPRPAQSLPVQASGSVPEVEGLALEDILRMATKGQLV
jgi:mediator of RNA polymerase II transcription subunit 8